MHSSKWMISSKIWMVTCNQSSSNKWMHSNIIYNTKKLYMLTGPNILAKTFCRTCIGGMNFRVNGSPKPLFALKGKWKASVDHLLWGSTKLNLENVQYILSRLKIIIFNITSLKRSH
jgi:hypothetical protein